ncbi:MAG: helix-turn-helix transcriptional regulator [Lachnospiraceae bacterium]|nr:helix-turn-helix transcriptional regulator [Lachnospiraceae bacterium]
MDNNYLIAIGKRLSQIRKSQKMTQEVLSEKLNISAKHVSHVERGISSYSLKNLIDFCEIFNCSLDYILLGKPNQNVLNKLPSEIIELLYTGSAKELEQLNRYLQFYIELSKKQD